MKTLSSLESVHAAGHHPVLAGDLRAVQLVALRSGNRYFYYIFVVSRQNTEIVVAISSIFAISAIELEIAFRIYF